MTPDKSKGPSASEGKYEKEKVFTLAPRKGKSIGLGVFPAGSDPHYEVTSNPDLEDLLGIAKEKIPLDQHRYMLLYQFHNFDDRASQITVRLVEKGDAHGS